MSKEAALLLAGVLLVAVLVVVARRGGDGAPSFQSKPDPLGFLDDENDPIDVPCGCI